MADQPQVSVKVSFKEDLRRLPGSTLASYSLLRQKITDLYGASLPEGFSIKYQDEEKDMISVTSDLELQEVCAFYVPPLPAQAVREAARLPGALLRLTIVAPAVPVSSGASKAADPAAAQCTFRSKFLSSLVDEASDKAKVEQLVSELLVSTLSGNNPNLLQSILSQSALGGGNSSNLLQSILSAVANPQAPTPAPVTSAKEPAPPVVPAPVVQKQPEPVAPAVVPAPSPAVPEPAKLPATSLPLAGDPVPAEPIMSVEFVQHENFPEESEVECGISICKVWRIKNTGAVPWPKGTYVVPNDGAVPSAVTNVAIEQEVKPGEEYLLGIAVVTPKEPGVCQASWRLKTPSGRSFGDPLYLNLKIVRRPPREPAGLPPPIAFTTPPANPVSVPVAVPVPAVLAAATNSPSPKPEHVAMQQAIAQAQLNHSQMSEQDKLLKQLSEMGFTERERNIQLLAKHNGNLLAVIAELINAA